MAVKAAQRPTESGVVPLHNEPLHRAALDSWRKGTQAQQGRLDGEVRVRGTAHHIVVYSASDGACMHSARVTAEGHTGSSRVGTSSERYRRVTATCIH